VPTVFVADEQSDHPVETERWMRLANDVLRSEEVGDDVEVSVMYVDEATIADLNGRFLDKTGPTDVLSFPIDDEPEEPGRSPDNGGTGPGSAFEEDEVETLSLLGDVVICPAVAMRNAPEHAGTYEDELALLLVHGLLHLLGMDHMEREEAEEMEQRERELLTEHYKSLPASTWASTEGGTHA
jgi:probable rRNA maturation factor